jgi:cell division protein ZapA
VEANSNLKEAAKQGDEMIAKKNKVTVEIYGGTYPLKSDAEPERIIKVATLLDERMRQTAFSNPRMNTTMVAILAALNIADDYLRLQNDYQQLLRMLNDK